MLAFLFFGGFGFIWKISNFITGNLEHFFFSIENSIINNDWFSAKSQEPINFSFSRFCLSLLPFPFFSSVSSLCGSPTGTDVSLKTLAKSCSKCGFIDWHLVTVQLADSKWGTTKATPEPAFVQPPGILGSGCAQHAGKEALEMASLLEA